MSIRYRCPGCHTENKIEAKRCSKCRCVFPAQRDRKGYRVRVMRYGRTSSQDVQDSLTKAKDTEATMIAALKEGIEYETPRMRAKRRAMTLDSVLERYLADYRARGKGARQFESAYKTHVRATFGPVPLDLITVALVEDHLAKMRADGYAEKTIAHVLDTISRLYRYAARLGLFDGRNPCVAVRKPRVNNKTTRYLTGDQLKKLTAVLAEHPDQRFANLIRFLLFTGCRQGEAFKLEWRDVDLDRKTIHLRDPKGGLDVTLPVNATAAGVLADQRARTAEGEPFVFPLDRGGKRTIRPWRPWFALRKAAGLPAEFRIHDLRHAYASMLASSGKVDLYTLQHLLTHKQVSTTQRYAHLFPDRLRRGAEAFDEILDEGEKKG